MPANHFNPQSTPESSENSSSPQNSLWDEPNRFHCSWHWHFRSMTSCFAPLLYDWGRYLSVTSDSFYPSAENTAKHLKRNRKTVLRALEELVKRGWAEVVHKEPGKPVTYRFIDHDEWARNHPGCCTVKDVMPWEGEGDPLGKQLYAISGGLAKLLPGQMKALRKSGMPDEQIAAEFQIFLERNPQKGSKWNSIFFRFHPYLIRLAEDLLEGVAVETANDQSLPRDTHQSLTRDTPVPHEGHLPVPSKGHKYLNVVPEVVTEEEDLIPAPLERSLGSTLSLKRTSSEEETAAPGEPLPAGQRKQFPDVVTRSTLSIVEQKRILTERGFLPVQQQAEPPEWETPAHVEVSPEEFAVLCESKNLSLATELVQ